MAKNKIAITSFYIGIAATAFGIIECFLPLIILGAVLGIIAIVLGIIGIKSEAKNKAFAGIVLGICGTIVSGIWLYLYIIGQQ